MATKQTPARIAASLSPTMVALLTFRSGAIDRGDDRRTYGALVRLGLYGAAERHTFGTRKRNAKGDAVAAILAAN